MALPFLQSIGLSKKEADIYEILLATGEIAVGELIKRSELKRATVYKILSTLEKKQLITKKDTNKKIHVRPSSPNLLLAIAEKEFDRLERAKMDLQKMLPEMTDQYVLSVERPIITEYEGVEGIKKVFDDIYAGKKEPVYGCVNLEIADKAVPDYISKKLIPLRIRNKVQAKTFLTNSSAAQKVKSKDAQQLRQTVLIDPEKYPLPAEIDVYEDKVALLSFNKGKFVGILIKNEAIATSLKSIFKYAFDHGYKP